MIKKLSLSIILMLTGCATVESTVDAFLMKFDTNEYKLISDIRTNANLSIGDCKDVQKSRRNVEQLYFSGISLKNYAEHLPHNKPIQKSSVDLFNIIDGMNKQYQNNDKVSEIFCTAKLKSIEANANTMQQMEGSKPR